jgi:alpha-amylase/alpha-mannosidase (GH57 family)
MDRYICIHGHFYQPPRENPWLESVELQDSAAPYHDWDQRIAAECYAPNASARLLDGRNRIVDIVNNYSRISFNFGPTLLAWIKEKMPDLHEAIVEADRQSRERFSGHGSAMAQAYSHMILPLANTRDKYTQVIWGIRDFESRFGRKPEGMWLAETAADTATLEVLAAHGIKFTVLSPFQASRTRKLGIGGSWKDVNGGRIDPSRCYLCRLPSGRSIHLFFYDAPVSQAIAFERLLETGEKFASRIVNAFSEKRNWDQLVNVATDGESYGHHHRYAEMALTYALKHIEENHLAKLTNYGEFLEKHPPTHEVQIHEGSAWSCSHGVGRWMRDCGCNSGGHAGWRQHWREPLRHALDWLRDELAPRFENKARELLRDPWAARDDYIQVIFNRAPEVRKAFYDKHATHELTEEHCVTVLELMELQRHAMLMYTSCGWFFDELSGIETVQVIQYAARAIQLARLLFGEDLEPGFLERLEDAKSNIPEHGNGRSIYEKFVRPAMIDWDQVVAHYGISSLFHPYGEKTKIFLYDFQEEERQLAEVGRAKLAIGRTKVEFEITHQSASRAYAVLYIGEHNLTGAVKNFATVEEFQTASKELVATFERGDFPETIRLLDRLFGPSSYSLKSLFKDEQRRILDEVMATAREDLEHRFRLITERYTPLMKFLEDVHMPWPHALQTASDYVLQSDISRLFQNGLVDLDRLRVLVANAQARNILGAEFSYTVTQKLEQMLERLASNPEDVALLTNLAGLAAIVMPIPVGLNVAKAQNTYFAMLRDVLPRYRDRAWAGEQPAREWLSQFLALGTSLQFALEPIQDEIARGHNGEQQQAA